MGTRHPLYRLAGGSLLIALGATLAGCGGPVRVADHAADDHAGSAASQRMAFWHELPRRSVISHDTAFHGLLLFFRGQDDAENYAGRRARLKNLGWIDEDFNKKGGTAIEQGTLAAALARALRVEGGVMMNLLGATPRYANRELKHLGILAGGSPQQLVTGGVFAGTIARAEDHMERHAPERAERLARRQRETVRLARVRRETLRSLADRGSSGDTLVPGARDGATATAVAQATRPRRGDAAADGDAASPATAPGDEALEIRIVAVEGMAQARAEPGKPWQRAESGMVLPRGAQVRTGPRSSVQIAVGDSQKVTLDRMGTIRVLEALERKGAIDTDLGLEYGRSTLELEVEAGGVEHQSEIRSAAATLAVRGSRGYLQQDAGRRSPVVAGADRGDVAWRNAAGHWVDLPPGAVQENDDTASGDRLARRNNSDDQALLRTDEEHELRGDHANGFFADRQQNINAFRENQTRVEQLREGESPVGEIPEDPADEFDPDVGERGDFRGQLVWSNDADLDLHMFAPPGVTVTADSTEAGPGIVEDPDPRHVFFDNPSATFRKGDDVAVATLDEDNVGGSDSFTVTDPTNKRIENIFVEAIRGENGSTGTGRIPEGEYEFFVESFTADDAPDSGSLNVDTDGDNEPDRSIQVQLQAKERSPSIIVTVPGEETRVETSSAATAD